MIVFVRYKWKSINVKIYVTEILRFALDDIVVSFPKPLDEGNISHPCLASNSRGRMWS